jgi:hypothetical protein
MCFGAQKVHMLHYYHLLQEEKQFPCIEYLGHGTTEHGVTPKRIRSSYMADGQLLQLPENCTGWLIVYRF